MSTTETTTETKFSLATRADMYKVPSSKLRTKEGFNIRTDYGNIDELKESIRVNGVKVPFRGYKDKEGFFIITDGHRRNMACQSLLEEGVEVNVPFILEAKGYSEEQRLTDMFVMNEGMSFNPLEKAEGVRRFIAYGYSEKEIGVKLSKSEGYIRKLNSLNSAPKKFLKLITNGTISATFAMAAIAEGKVDEILAKVASGEGNPSEQKIATDESVEATTTTDGKEIKELTEKKKPAQKITAKDVAELNSVKEFKKFMRNANEDLMDENKLYIFQFATKLMNNELTGDQITEFFKAN